MDARTLYGATGNQIMAINTLFQLLAVKEQALFNFFQDALFPHMNGLLRDPKHLCVFLFGAVFEVKLVDQLIMICAAPFVFKKKISP